MKQYDFLVDSHCHLDLLAEKGLNIDDIVARSEQNGVKILQTICTKFADFGKIYQYAQKYDNVFASVGVHPCNVNDEDLIKAQQIVEICQKYPKVIGIGETGLDYYHPGFDKNRQIASFLEHIKAARETGLPLIIHSRDADEDMIKILQEEMKKGEFKALLHCFSSSKMLAEEALKIGVYISASGILTFKNAKELQEIIKNVPLEYLLVETDAPYLAPMPHRGKTNEPSFTKHTAEFLADLKNISFQEVQNITTGNFYRLFSKCR